MKIHIILIYCLFFMSACSTKTVEDTSSTVLLPNLDILKEISDTIPLAKSEKINNKFFIVLLFSSSFHDWNTDTTYIKEESIDTLFIEEIEKINWLSQEYFFKKDSLEQFNTRVFGGGSLLRIVFMFNFKEIYRAGLTSRAMCCPLPKGIAKIEGYKEPYSGKSTWKTFQNDHFQVTHLERAIIDKKLYFQAGVYLYNQGLLINE